MSVGNADVKESGLPPHHDAHYGVAEQHDLHSVSVVRQRAKVALQDRRATPNHVQHVVSFARQELFDRVPAFQRHLYEADFRSADEAFQNARVEATSKKRTKHYAKRTKYVRPLQLEPDLSNASYVQQQRALSGFAAIMRNGLYSGRVVQAGTASGALTAVGTTVALDQGVNPAKLQGTEKFTPRLSDVIADWRKDECRVIHIRRHTSNRNALLSAFWEDGVRSDVTDDDIRRHIKADDVTLRHKEVRGIKADDVDTHSLCSGGTNTLHMAGYSNR